MGKLSITMSSTVFSVTIFALLLLSVGLLVFVLKGQIQHENSMSSKEPIISDEPQKPSTAKPPVSSVTESNEIEDVVNHTVAPGQPSHGHLNLWEDFRLPKYIIPLNYDLLLHPNLRNDTFSGSVNITLNVTEPTRHFVVHAYRLVVLQSRVYRIREDVEVGVRKTFLYDPHEYFVVEVLSEVNPGLYMLGFDFTGSLVGGIVGFYKSRYTDSLNNTRYLATSKFQPTYARRAFPCLDEPSFKATFQVSLVHEPEYIALSNMPVSVIEPYSDHLLVTSFQKSVPMVTYLSCFIVCDFDYKGTKTSDGKQFRVYSTPHQVNKTEYAVKFGSRVLEYFEDYFGISYPLPKQDMVAIPDFVSGAMEHWGVITFRETNLLTDNSTSPQSLQRVSLVIAHEMTHMWFGNLVTMEWWDDLWLNEGFASYVEYKGVHEQHPDWEVISQFVTEDMQPVMDLDSTLTSHPIVQPVKNPDEITEIFDHISYGKGASVLRMLEFFVGPENFRKGISQFLKKHQFGNARTSDLWEEIHNACGRQGGRNISSIMNSWTQQMGYPYITVFRDENNSSEFSAYQQRFLKDEESYRELKNSSAESIWSIPLSYATSRGDSGIVWIHDNQKVNFSIPVDDSDWVKFNINQTGYYLVNYETKEWERLSELLKNNHEILSPSDRSNLLFDSFQLAEAGHISFDVFLGMSAYLKNETHLIPWETAYSSFVYFAHLLEATDTDLLLKSYVEDLTNPIYKKLGWNTVNQHLDNLLQTTIIGLACHSGNEDCLNEASELFQSWTQGQEVPATLRGLVYHYGIAEIGREEHWNYMWNRYLSEESASERKILLYGLAHVRIPSLIQRYLEYAVDETKIRRQDFFHVLTYIAGNPIGRKYVWSFLREKWPSLVERFTLNDRYLGNAVKKICQYFSTEYELQEMNSFFAKYPEAGAGKRRRLQAIESVQNNIKWLRTHKNEVKHWLQTGTDPWLNYRLPPHIVPVHYDLTVYPDLENAKFSGSVTISVRLDKPSDYILVHSRNLNITETEVTSLADNQFLTPETVFAYLPNHFWVITFDRKLPVGKYSLHFEFVGDLSESSATGLYLTSYMHPRLNEKRLMAATQFESTHARKAFPCFDEPSFRSTFTVRLRHNSSRFALSNTMVQEVVELDNGLLETRFEKSVSMVTYLLCLVVCDFEYKETFTENGLRLRVYTAEHIINKTDYALETGRKIITHFEEYFDLPFPLKKLDMIGIPGIASGGMENWGLITLGYKDLICTSDTPLDEKFWITKLLAHEIAHMWFGNLVTMKWWDDLWLNEGFSTYAAVMGVQHIEPAWDVENQFLLDSWSRSLNQDSSVNSHPIVQNIRKSNEISDAFDSISYSKGASVLRMLEHFMEEDFRIGLTAYLKKYAFGNANTEDLWKELSAASRKGFNVTSLMHTWTKQMNYPYIAVKRGEETVTLSQHHFLSDPMSKYYVQSPSPYGYIWEVPITYRTSENNNVDFIILNSTQDVSISVPDSAWVKINVNFTGYFLVNYEEQDWIRFAEMLQADPNVFSPTDRTSLLFDSFSLASSGNLDYGIPLNLSLYIKNETHFGPLSIAGHQLRKIKNFLKPNPETRELMTEYLRMLSKDLLRKFTWNDTGDYNEKKTRSAVIDLACGNGNYECLTTAVKLLKGWMKGEKLSANIKTAVFEYGMRTLKDENTWNIMWNRYLNETDPQEKNFIMEALGSVRNESLLRRYAEYAKNVDYVNQRSYFQVLTNIANNPDGLSFVTDFLFSNWTEILHRTKNPRLLEDLGKRVFGQINTEKGLKKVQDLHRKHRSKKLSGRQRRDTIELIRNNIRLFNQHHSKLSEWLQKNVRMPWRKLRLPDSITPTRYDIKIQPNISESTFNGSVTIEVNIAKATDMLIVHQKKLTIDNTELILAEDGSVIAIDEVMPYDKNQFWVIKLVDVAHPGMYYLKLAFSGIMEEEGFGLGKYSYSHKVTGEVRYAGLTMFEPTNARKAFPCFDEPVMKAKFKLTIVHDSKYSAISNMPEESKHIRSAGLIETAFEETVPMSTYLLCFVVSDYDYLETDYRGKKIRTYAPPDRVHLTEHSLNFTVKILEFFEDFFNITYALPKLDSVSIPGYAPNGMEHWGLVFYKETRFLVKKSHSKRYILEEVDLVIAHELAHQWFGNLVTMKWWSDVWLNEGFSTFTQYVALKPFYEEAQEVYVKDISMTMRRDSSLDGHPIIADASHPDEILNMFDDISYRKGAAILKMLDYTLKDDFRKGVTNYLKKFAFGNTDTKDLWNELSMASKSEVNISEVMDTWTIQMGFPFVEIKRTEGQIIASQEWFVNERDEELLIEARMKNPHEYMWKIPLVYKDMDTGYEESFWLNQKVDTFPTNASTDSLLKFNPEFVGFYIVKYEDEDWKRFAKALLQRHEDFLVTDRYNLLHDAIRLASSGRILYDIPFEMSKYLKKERSLINWEIFFNEVKYILRKLGASGETFELLLKYLKNLSSELYEPEVAEKNESNVLLEEIACYSNNEICLQLVREEFQLWMQGENTTLPLDLILSVSSRFGDETIWKQMYSRFELETDEDTGEALAESLAQFRDPMLINRTLRDLLFNPEVSRYLAQRVYRSFLSNPIALPKMLDLLQNNWSLLKDRLGKGIARQCSYFKTINHLSEMIRFFRLHPELNPEDALDCISGIQSRIEWSDKYEENLLTWLRWNVSEE